MNILDTIGNTPLQNIDNIYFKMEMFNPTGSIKDRVAKAMILDYVDNNKCDGRNTMVEATSGNTGISIAMVCATLGLKCRIYVPNNTSKLKIKMMKAYSADVIKLYDDIASCIEGAQWYACMYARIGNCYHYLDQFNNKYNVEAQKEMAQEANDQLTKEYMNAYLGSEFFDYSYYKTLLPDAIVAGVGTGGTLMGLHNIFPEAELFILQVPDGEHIEGICDGVKLSLIPKKLQLNTINVTYAQAYLTAKWLATKHGIHCGVSSGANYYASTVIKNKYKRILTVLPDAGWRYL